MKYIKVKNPQWANAEKTIINCNVNFEHVKEEFVPFTANPMDEYEHSKAIFIECLDGKYGVIADYVAPIIDPVTPPAPIEVITPTQAV